jgi:hypothetical protein
MAWKRCAVGALAALLLLGLAVPGRADEGKAFAAAASNVFYVPGKVLTCAAGGVIWAGGMLLTLGTAYNPMANVVRETCGGPWVVTPSNIRYYPSFLNTPPAFTDSRIGAQ